MGEAGSIQLLASSQVLDKIERTLRAKAERLLPALAVTLDRIRLEVVRLATPAQSEFYAEIMAHPADALILVAALEIEVDFFVTLDRKHLLNNQPLRKHLPFPMRTPGDCISWYRNRLLTEC